jgi:voltage-gated potassium channel
MPPRRAEDDPQPRILPPVALLAMVIGLGGLAVWAVGRGRWPLGDAIYLAVNAVSTVGFHELDGMDRVRFARGVTVVIIIAGLGSVAYFQSSLTALLVQGVIGRRFRVKRMQTRIESLEDHIVVAGAGSTGMHVIEELHATDTPYIVLDRDRAALERIGQDVTAGRMLYLVGDATDDSLLVRAGITRCRGVVAALTEDRDNLYVTLSARSLNATARIVTKVIHPDAAPKMVRAGANATVSPNMIGGRRMASEMMRPTVVQFVDQMLLDKEKVLRLEEVTIPEGSWFIGKTLREVPIRAHTNLLVVALRIGDAFLYNPEPNTELEAGSVLVVIGESRNVARLRELVLQREPG